MMAERSQPATQNQLAKTLKERKAEDQARKAAQGSTATELAQNEDTSEAQFPLISVAWDAVKPLRILCFGDTKIRSIPAKSISSDLKQLGLIHYLPGFNIIYDILFEVSPLPTETMRTLNVMALICGLLTSVVAAIMMNGSYDEFATTLDRWESDGTYGDYGRRIMEQKQDEYPGESWTTEVNYGEFTYLLYMENVSTAGTKILGGLLCTVIMYISLSNTSFTDAHGTFSYPLLAAWWTWARWVMLMNIVWICQGVWFFLAAMYINYKLRRPWPKFERENAREPALDGDTIGDGTGPDGVYRRRPQNYLSTQGTNNIMYPVLLIFFGFLAIGLTMKSRAYVAIRKKELKNIQALNEAVEAAVGPELFNKFGHFILASKIDPDDLPELTDPYEMNRLLSIPLGPAIKMAKRFKKLRGSTLSM